MSTTGGAAVGTSIFRSSTDTRRQAGGLYCGACGEKVAMTESAHPRRTPEEVIADALALAGGVGGMHGIGRFPEVYTRRAEAIAQALREAGMLRD